jgi:hypothetical protein
MENGSVLGPFSCLLKPPAVDVKALTIPKRIAPPVNILMGVVLPTPLGPRKPKTVPSATANDTPSTAT